MPLIPSDRRARSRAPLLALGALGFRLVACGGDAPVDPPSGAAGQQTSFAGFTTAGGFPPGSGGFAGRGGTGGDGAAGSAFAGHGGMSGSAAGKAGKGGGGSSGANGDTPECVTAADCFSFCLDGQVVHVGALECVAGKCKIPKPPLDGVVTKCTGGCTHGVCEGEGADYKPEACTSDAACTDRATCFPQTKVSGGKCVQGLCLYQNAIAFSCTCPTPYCSFNSGTCASWMTTAGGSASLCGTGGAAGKGSGGKSGGGGGNAGTSSSGSGGSAPQSCTDPSTCTLPPSTCSGNDLVFYTAPDCVDSLCTATAHTEPCSGMCMDGQCVPMAGGGGGSGP